MSRSRLVRLTIPALLAASSCADVDHPSAPDATPTSPSVTGTARVKTVYGTRTMRYRVHDGRAIAEGDIDLGPAAKLATWANLVVDTTRRWPDGVVTYAIDPAIPLGDSRRTRLAEAIAHYQQMTPIRFVAQPDDFCPPADLDCTDHVWVTTTDLPGVGGLSALGFQGGRQNLRLSAGASRGTVIHELGHTLGLYHEQNRPDRDTYVQINLACIDTGDEPDDAANEIDWTNQYDENGAGTDFGVYDFASIMHYSSSGGRDEDYLNAPCSGHQPMERRPGVSCPASICTDPGNDGVAEYISGQRNWLSPSDINSMWGAYGSGLGAAEAGDRFGSAVAAADFDGDGVLDLAVGGSGEDIGAATDTGAVFVYKGTGEGLQPWMTITQAWLGGASETTDELGASLAVGDLDGDGYPDLAIGAPGEMAGAVSDVGAVFVARGSAAGLVPSAVITQATVGEVDEGDDRFGAALAIGDFTGDGVGDLAIGAPGEQPGAAADAGRVFILRGQLAGALVSWDQLGQEELGVVGNGGLAVPPVPLGTPAAGDRFGWSLAAGRLDGDARDDLIVGAMCDADTINCGGAVYVFRGAAASMQGWRRLQRAAPLGLDRLGMSVATLDLDADGDGDIVAGAPFATAGGQAGAGFVQRWTLGANNNFVDAGTLSQSGFAANEIGDNFGAALATLPRPALWAPTQLFVGVPVEGTSGDTVETGVVQRFTINGGALTHNAMLRESPVGIEEDDDDFGASVAAATLGVGTQIFVGTPGENNDTGAVYVFSSLGNVVPGHQQVLQQHDVGSHAP